jgi:hypothetical protein
VDGMVVLHPTPDLEWRAEKRALLACLGADARLSLPLEPSSTHVPLVASSCRIPIKAELRLKILQGENVLFYIYDIRHKN